ncbi:hypothetical protein PENTCL1PPCAC_3216 [Pristionchus entomophagus]|uniref:Uncharacterized protein n=1 Tax=Pristionchus entomophagus TaxID=358040 RepID=A0AAV5SCF9_9BILA|nr:hypothetical protein PENTCL1PPCAC_3216 [Pristionchus entomophagus]
MKKSNKQTAPASAASSSTTSAASRRGQKTLGWFLSEELIEKTATNNTSSPSPPVQTSHRQQTTSTSSSNAAMAGGAQMMANASAEEKKRRGGRGHRQRKLTESLSTASEASLPMLEGDEKDTTLTAAPPSDFYVYDVASDGYYYEQNGAKGWRRRLPQGVQPKKPTGAAAAAAATTLQQQQQNEELHRQAELAATAVQRNHMNALQAAMAQPTAYNRYYDAPSDGYFFEMASVDGWRKRTAAPSAGAPAAFGARGAAGGPRGATPTAALYGNGSAPLQFLPTFAQLQQQQQYAAAVAAAAAPNQSYGAALARGELPAKCMIESSASSSVSDDLSYPSLSRPTSLDLNTMAAFGAAGGMDKQRQDAAAAPHHHHHHHQQLGQEQLQDASLFQWNADKFIEELVGQFSTGSRLDAFSDAFGGANLKTPATSMWANRRFSATTATSSTSGAMTGGEEEQEDQEEYALTKELENIWKTPTPVQN